MSFVSLYNFFIITLFPTGKSPATGSLAQSQNPAAPTSITGLKEPLQSTMAIPLNVVAVPAVPSTTTLSSSTPLNVTQSTAVASSSTPTSTVKKQRPLLPRETMPVVQRAVVWNTTAKFQTSSQKWHMQKVQRQQQSQAQPATQTQILSQTQRSQLQQTQVSPLPPAQQPSSSTRYQTRQAVKGRLSVPGGSSERAE